jgi:hypothetical protein
MNTLRSLTATGIQNKTSDEPHLKQSLWQSPTIQTTHLSFSLLPPNILATDKQNV